MSQLPLSTSWESQIYLPQVALLPNVVRKAQVVPIYNDTHWLRQGQALIIHLFLILAKAKEEQMSIFQKSPVFMPVRFF